MQQAKFTSLVAAVVAAVLLGSAGAALLNLGDTYVGTINLGDTDLIEFAGVKGEKFGITVKASKGSNLMPTVRLIDLTTMSTIVPLTFNKKKVKVKGVELPSTGLYRVEIAGQPGTIGAFSAKTSSKIGKAVKKRTNQMAIGPEELQETMFDAKVPINVDPEKDVRWMLNGTIQSPKKSDAVPFNPTLSGPSSEGGDPVELTGFITKKNDKFTIKDLPLPELGTYVLSVGNSGLSGVINTKLNIKTPKVKKRTIDETDLPVR